MDFIVGKNLLTWQKKMEKIIDLCLSLGINTFDLADIYAGYTAEHTFGEIISRKNVKREEPGSVH
ncbi:MAG: aldo/keto reductase [Chitinophagaceae bacterium]|nr:aldo/keto reductase [Chitinophagaceae bacterium]